MAFCGYLKQSTTVTIKLGPFVDDADGKTLEAGLTIEDTDITLSKNGAAFAAPNDTNNAAYDSAGYYGKQINTTDTGTLGMLTVECHKAGALPVRQDYQVVTANWWDTLCSTDQLDVNVTNVAGTSQTANDNGADINAILADTNELQTDDYPTSIAAIKAETALIVADTDELQTDDVPGLLDALEIAGLDAAGVWSYASRTLTQTAAEIAAAVSGSDITITRGDTFSATLTGLGALTGYVSVDFSVKGSRDDADDNALVRIRKNASDADDGLLRLNRVAATAGNGSITIDDEAAGDITIALDAAEAATLGAAVNLVYDVQLITASAVTTLTYGACTITGDVTRAVV